MRLCLPARMGGGGKAESTPWRGPAGQRALGDRHSGAAIPLWEREGKALGVPVNQGNGGDEPPSAAARHRKGTLARCDADGRCGGKRSRDKAVGPTGQRRQSQRTRARRPTGKDRGESASGSAQGRRTLKERSGKECDPRKSRSTPHAPDRHPQGQDYRLGARRA